MTKQPQFKKIPITIAILLGGESSRFGSPKAFLPWKDKSLAAHLAQIAGPWAHEVLFIGKNENQVPEDARPFARFVADEPGFPGPLAGLAAALVHVAKPWVFLTGVDMPYLNERILHEFWNLRERSVLLGAVVPHVHDRWQPLCALWNRHALNLLKVSPRKSFQDFLNNGGLKVTPVEENTLRSWDPELLCLRGFNTKEEFELIKGKNHVP